MALISREISIYNVGFKHPLIDVATEDLKLTVLDLLSCLNDTLKCKSYLEIGDGTENIFSIMKNKISNSIYIINSDDYFNIPFLPVFDLIFIDGNHISKHVIKEIQNSLKHLSPGGAIVIHDCKPRDEKEAIPIKPSTPQCWNGDVWKAALWSRLQSDLDCATLNTDWGSMVIMKRPNSDPILFETYKEFSVFTPIEIIDKVNWSDYIKHQETWIRSMTFDYLKKWLIGPTKEIEVFKKTDRDSLIRLLIISNNSEFISRASKMPYGNIWIYSQADISMKSNLIWSEVKDGSPKELADLAEKEYCLNSFSRPKELRQFPDFPIPGSLISIFTVTDHPERLKRSYKSLISQTHTNWEWNILVINGDWIVFDDRIHIIKGNKQDSKFIVAGMCRGDILLELNSGDELMNDSLEMLLETYKSPFNPVFVYGNYVETDELNPTKTLYHDIPFYGSYHYEMHKELGWIAVMSGLTIDSHTCQNPIYLPLYCNSWRKDFYQFIGGFSKLLIAEDYELILRTCAYSSRIMNLPQLFCVHYHDFMPIITACFQRISKLIYQQYEHLLNIFDCNIYRKDELSLMFLYDDKFPKIIKSDLIPSEILVIGDNTAELNEEFISAFSILYPKIKIKWWNYQNIKEVKLNALRTISSTKKVHIFYNSEETEITF